MNYTKKGLNDLDNHNGVVTHIQPDILECEVKWALGSITMNKASGGFPVELFQILKDDVVKVLHSICQNILENSAVARGLETAFIPIPRRAMPKNVQSTT